MMGKNLRQLIFGLVALTLPSVGVTAQNLKGAWRLVENSGQTVAGESIKIYSDNYFMFGLYSEEGAFVKAGGGKYNTRGTEYIEVPDFDTSDSTIVRKPPDLFISLSPKRMNVPSRRKKSGGERKPGRR